MLEFHLSRLLIGMGIDKILLKLMPLSISLVGLILVRGKKAYEGFQRQSSCFIIPVYNVCLMTFKHVKISAKVFWCLGVDGLVEQLAVVFELSVSTVCHYLEWMKRENIL